MTSKESFHLKSDGAVQTIDEDKLGRTVFAYNIARALIRPLGSPSFVIGLEGGWGTGKTSLLNFVEISINSQWKEGRNRSFETEEKTPPKPLIYHFDPWLVGGRDILIESFLKGLAQRLGTLDVKKGVKKVLKAVDVFADAYASANKMEPTTSGVAKAVSKVSRGLAQSLSPHLSEIKGTVVKRLEGFKRPIIVFIDDIDRLPPEEVQTLFQLVKAVANFPNVTYLLAYDPKPVAQALRFSDTYDGQAYLHKIVQAPYHVPRVSEPQLGQYARDRLDELFSNLELGLEEHDFYGEKQRWEESTTLPWGGILHHLRGVKRLINRLQVTIPATRGEVDLTDVVAFEALRMGFPGIEEILYRFEEWFLVGYSRWSFDIQFDQFSKDEKEKQRDKILAEFTLESDKLIVGAFLDFLFPTLTKESPSSNPMLIVHAQAYFCLMSTGIEQGRFLSKDISEFLYLPKKREAILDAWLEERDFGWGIRVPNLIQDNKPVPDISGLATLLDENVFQDFESVNRITEWLRNTIIPAIMSHKDPSIRENDITNIVKNAKCLNLSEVLVHKSITDKGLWVHRKGQAEPIEYQMIVDEEVLEEVRLAWLENVRERFQSDILALFQESDPLSIFFRWGQLSALPDGDFSEVQEYLQKATQSVPGMKAFLGLWKGVLPDRAETLILSIPEFISRVDEMELDAPEELLSYLKGKTESDPGENNVE